MKATVLVVALVLGCQGNSKISGASPSPSPHASPTIPKRGQMVTAVVDDWSSTHATLRLWERSGSHWQQIGESWPAVVGVHGLARDRDKREGDGKSPAGMFPLRTLYGYAPSPPAGTKLPYKQVDASWQCVDDPSSKHYGDVLDKRSVEKADRDWKSAEEMKRSDELYTWVIDTTYNNLHEPSRGSCIFLHVWHGPDAPTVGCTAMAESDLVHLVAQLDPEASPLFVLLPQSEYRAVATQWGLPPQ